MSEHRSSRRPAQIDVGGREAGRQQIVLPGQRVLDETMVLCRLHIEEAHQVRVAATGPCVDQIDQQAREQRAFGKRQPLLIRPVLR
jgi:hypothetical protein